MKMKIHALVLLLVLATLQACKSGDVAPVDVTGCYSNGQVAVELKDGQWIGYVDGKRTKEGVFFVKGGRIYMSPDRDELSAKGANAYRVCDISGDVLIFGEVVNVETGKILEKIARDQARLRKQKPNQRPQGTPGKEPSSSTEPETRRP